MEREVSKAAMRRWRMTHRRRPSSRSVANASGLLLAALLIMSAPLSSSLSSSEAPAVEQQPPEGAFESPEMSTTRFLDSIVDGTCLDYRKAGEYWSYRWCHERNVSDGRAEQTSTARKKHSNTHHHHHPHHHRLKARIKGTKCARLFYVRFICVSSTIRRSSCPTLALHPRRAACSASFFFSVRGFVHVPGHSPLLLPLCTFA